MNEANFLDVDESIKIKNLLLPNKDRDALNNQMDELMKQFDSKPSILVQPTPGICLKTTTNNGEKVFINICVSDKIPPPADISENKLIELLNDEVPTYTIPMSIGNERMEADNAGTPSATFDVMINTEYLKKCQEKQYFMAFTVLVVLSGVADKYNRELDTENFVIFKNRKVIGKLQQHRIEDRESKKVQNCNSLIEEISHSVKPNNSKAILQDSNSAKTGYIILKYPREGPAERVIVLFEMPKSVSIEDIVVLINSDRINVTDEKACCSYDIFLPYTLKADNAKASFDYNIKILRLDILVEQK